jgi:hypothetical protein
MVRATSSLTAPSLSVAVRDLKDFAREVEAFSAEWKELSERERRWYALGFAIEARHLLDAVADAGTTLAQPGHDLRMRRKV